MFRHANVVCLCLVFILRLSSMLVEDARGAHIEEPYSRAGLMTVLYVAVNVSFCLPHGVTVSVFIICRGLCACTKMLCMHVH